MRLPASLTCRRLAPLGLGLRLSLVALSPALAVAAPPPAAAPSKDPDKAQTLADIASSYPSARAFAQSIAQGAPDLAWPEVKAYLLAPRSASPVDYRNVLAEIGISPKHAVADTHAWLEALVELPQSRISDPLQPVFCDLLVTAGLLHWLGAEIRHDPDLRREGLQLLLDMAAHHRGTFVTGVDDAIVRNSLWAIPTLLLVRANQYGHPVPDRTQARVPDWIAQVKADPLRTHAPTRIRNPQVMQDFLLALTAIDDPMLAAQIWPALSAPNRPVRTMARTIARFIASSDEQARSWLKTRLRKLGANPDTLRNPSLSQRQALARKLKIDDLDTLSAKLEAHLSNLDQERSAAWDKAVRKALDDENFDRLSALFAQDPGSLVSPDLVQETVQAMDLQAGERLNRQEERRAGELWARAHAIAKAYELKDHALLATKRDNALLSVQDLSSHARRTLHRSLRPQAKRLATRDRPQTPPWKGSAFALFSVLLLPGAWMWARRRI